MAISSNQPVKLRAQAESLASTLPPLQVAAERVAATLAQGFHGRKRVGVGESFWQYRPFTQSDTRSVIDWRKSAKSDHLLVRETEWEASESVWIWRDNSPSMQFASSKELRTKHNEGSIMAIALCSLLTRAGERIASTDLDMPPGQSRVTYQRIAEHFATSDQRSDSKIPDQEFPRHAQMVWITDFLTPLQEIETAIRAHSGREIKGHVVHLIDPSEETFPFTGRVEFEGMEKEGRIIFGRSEAIRSAYQRKFNAHRQAVADITRAHDWTYLAHRTDQPVQNTLLSLFFALSSQRENGKRV